MARNLTSSWKVDVTLTAGHIAGSLLLWSYMLDSVFFFMRNEFDFDGIISFYFVYYVLFPFSHSMTSSNTSRFIASSQLISIYQRCHVTDSSSRLVIENLFIAAAFCLPILLEPQYRGPIRRPLLFC